MNKQENQHCNAAAQNIGIKKNLFHLLMKQVLYDYLFNIKLRCCILYR